MDGYFPLFPYNFIHRIEEVAGSNPARSTKSPKGGDFMINTQFSGHNDRTVIPITWEIITSEIFLLRFEWYLINWVKDQVFH